MNKTQETYEIPYRQLGKARKLIAKIQKRAAKLGKQLPTITEGKKVTRNVTIDLDPHGINTTQIPVLFVEVTLTHTEAIKIAGYEILAAIDHGEAVNVLRTYDNAYDFAPWFEAPASCEHCAKNRRRKMTVLLRDNSNNVLQVGKTCLKDFTGHDPKSALALCELIEQLRAIQDLDEESLDFGNASCDGVTLQSYLGWVIAETRDAGEFVTRSAVYESGGSRLATADAAMISGYKVATDKDYDDADKVIEWAVSLKPETTFDMNLQAIAINRYVTRKQLGLAAYMAQAKARADEKLVQEKLRATQVAKMVHVGTVGKREAFEVKFSRVSSHENQWGMTHRHVFYDAQGNELVWWGSYNLEYREDVEPGDALSLKATVKKHEVYKGTPQTVITRVKVLECAA